NRRGIAPAVHCRACGATRRCPNCDVALTLHGDHALHCHHCGRMEPMGETCPTCGSAELARIGAGTQRLEKELAKHLPELEVIRLDADVDDVREPLARFARAKRAVLVGTQMVAKGHHFAGVELAAVVDADTVRALEELKAGLAGHELLGPAPLLRLRGKHRAQLVAKTGRPRALAARAAALLSAAAPAMRRAGLSVVVDVDPQSL